MSAAKDYGLTQREADALTWALHLDRQLHAACGTNRRIRLGTMRLLEADRLVRETRAYMVDGDGFTLRPERERRCFALTALGRDIAEQAEASQHHEARERHAYAMALFNEEMGGAT